MASAQCKHCGHERSREDQLGLYCSNCGKPRLPFSSLFFFVPLVGLTVAFFVSELAQPGSRRPLLMIVLVLVVAWISGLILRHRPRATRHVVAVLVATTLLVMHVEQWGTPRVAFPEPWLVWLSAAAAIAGGVTLAIYAVSGLARGFELARRVGSLGASSLVLVVIAFAGLVVTALHFLLPLVVETVDAWIGDTGPGRTVLGALGLVATVVAEVVRIRGVLVLVAGSIVVIVAIVAALRESYRSGRKFSTLRTSVAVLLAIGRNIFSIIRDTVVRVLLLLRGLASVALLAGLSLVLVRALFEIARRVAALWTTTRDVGLTPQEWGWLALAVAVAAAAWIGLLVVGSNRYADDRSGWLKDLAADLPRLTQAVGYAAFILSLAFLANWLIAITYFAFVGRPVRGWIVFGVVVAVYVVAALVGGLVTERERVLKPALANLRRALGRDPGGVAEAVVPAEGRIARFRLKRPRRDPAPEVDAELAATEVAVPEKVGS